MGASLPVILIHGAWQGAWVWERFAPLLASSGYEPIVIDLPGNGTDNTPPEAVTLDLYVRFIADIIEKQSGKVAIIAHSGAGVIASQVAETVPERIAGLVYIAGMMLPDGVSYGDLVREALPDHPESAGVAPSLIWSEDRLTSSVPLETALAHLLTDVAPAEAAGYAAKYRPQPEGGRATRPHITAERFGAVPRLYVEATEDRSVYLHLQRRMQALVPGAEVVSLATGHGPHVTAPDALLEAISPFLARLTA